jgi:branched-chain amino acid transport system ATP-binding protein
MALLEVRRLSKHFGGVAANSNVSLTINEHEIVSIIGPNGAGKTTLFNLISGVDRPDDGTVHFNGEYITFYSAPKIARLGLVRTFQQTKIFRDLTVVEAVMTGRHLHDRTTLLASLLSSPLARQERRKSHEKALAIIEFLGMQTRQNNITQNLPYGEQKLLNIAIALAAEPKLLLLDEPAAGTNPIEAKRLMETIRKIKETGVTVGLVEHNMRLVMNISEKVFVLNYGELIAEGTPEDILKNTEVIDVYLGRRKRA